MKDETKEDRFKRVAGKRVQRVLESIRGLSQCSNKRMYKWTDQMLRKMWASIEQELENCKTSFKKSEPEEFQF